MIKRIKHWKTTVPIQQKIKIVLNLKIKKSYTLTCTLCAHRSDSVCAVYASLRIKVHLKKYGFTLREECKLKILKYSPKETVWK
jgi:hypothetical protein